MKFYLLSLVFAVSVFAGLLTAPLTAQPYAASAFYKIVSQDNRGMVIRFDFDKVEMRQLDPAREDLWSFHINGLNPANNPGNPLLPVLSLPLTLPEGKTQVSVTESEFEDYPGRFPVRFEDTPVGAGAATISSPQSKQAEQPLQAVRSVFPENCWQLSPLGLFRDYRLASLQIYPLQVLSSGVRFHKQFTITIRFNAASGNRISALAAKSDQLDKWLLNPTQAAAGMHDEQSAPVAKHTMPGYMNTQVSSRLRIILDEDGLYRVTGADLREAGIQLDDITLSAIRLSNRGKDTPLLLYGYQDGRFDEGDAFEFWGERNVYTRRAQSSDQYSDPFSNENVYWLTWGDTPGNRMVEENGSLNVGENGQFNRSFNFRHTEHVEKDDKFERLGAANEETLSYTRDHWFFNLSARAVGKRPVPFELIYPDANSFNNVEVTAMMSGLSFGATFDDGNPATDDRVPHDVQIWLNNGFVGSGPATWFNQDTARVSNAGASTLRNADLLHGTNVLEVQLPTLPDITTFVNGERVVTKGTDIVLLNWFEVTYDRLYQAHKNKIEFRRPSFIPFPNTDLFQFELTGFSRPDIGIYKKGISRIVNFKIDQEEIAGETRYRATFQDEVLTDDIEYIALTDEKKKKPLRIEKDLPFDRENPSRLLHDSFNAAEYLIITHQRFENGARELLDYRRSRGVSAEMVFVQDIYDEFNFGIKSPLAIRDFLRYAFFNWLRIPRLKYVVLVGDAHFDYKTRTETNGDFVPTFFYQTQSFGATATDYPYSLIVGDDDIPDLAIGRVPAATNSDVLNLVDKLREYEESPAPGNWRSQALFISGNDLNTYELENRFGKQMHAFRSQNTRIMSTLLPRHLSGVRLNTVRNEDLPPNVFDPDFGTRTSLIERWNDGLFFINFMGHGGGGIWADVNLMDIPDVDLLNNKGAYPFVTSMTCFTGAYEDPRSIGLAEKLLLAPEKGAIGILASSGLGYLHNDYTMLWYIGQFMFTPDLTLGESMLLGKILYLSNGSYNVNGRVYGTPGYSDVRREMVYQYTLLGDPLTGLQYTAGELTVSLDKAAPQRGDTLEVTVDSPFFGGEGYLELVDRDFRIIDRQPLFAGGRSTVSTLVIPDNFVDGTGLIRAFLSDGVDDAAGEAPIGVNYAVINSITFTPAAPDVDDSVQVGIRAEDVNGIAQVYLLRESSNDTLTAQPDPQDPALFLAMMPPTGQLKTVFFNVYVKNQAGNISLFSNQRYTVSDARPDIAFLPNSLRFAGRRSTRLQAGIENRAGAGRDNQVLVHVFAYDGEQNYRNNQFFSRQSVRLNAADSGRVELDFPLPQYRSNYDILLRAVVDSLEDVEDFNSINDTLRQELLPTIFTVSPATGAEPITLQSRIEVTFSAGSLSDSSAVEVALKTFDAPANQSGLAALPLFSANQLHALSVRLLNPEAAINLPYKVRIALNAALLDTQRVSLQDVRLYRQGAAGQPWIFTPSVNNSSGDTLTAFLERPGSYALFLSDDQQAPSVELTADGRPLRASGLVGTSPSLYLIVQDASGINLEEGRLRIRLNNQPIPEDKIVVPDSAARNDILGISLTPELLSGSHDLAVRVEDINGLATEASFQLVVTQNFDLRVYGNYPNPFSDRTIFSYFIQLNDNPDDFEIRIYTVSGRRIRTLDRDANNPVDAIDGGVRRQGYNELIWDGTDDKGREVANGVYFAVVRVSYEGEVREKTMKIAKLK